MIYEIRMTVSFIFKEGRPVQSGYDRMKVTLIDYIEGNGVGEAFNKAAEYKHEVAVKIAKGESELFTRKAWGERSDRILISLDAVVAKPEIEGPLPINIAGHYRSASGDMIPVPRKTLKSHPELIKDKNFFSLESYSHHVSED